MNILEQIIGKKREEVAEKKELFPIKLLEKSIYFSGKPVSMSKYLLREDRQGIIAEIKRKSPSKGDINPHVSVERTSIGYMQAGASGLSILTDTTFFGGKNEDLTTARKYNFCPILRKDFTIDPYQVIEAKSIGADTILLIAAVLSSEEIKELSHLAKSLGMEVLLEVHNEEELNKNLDSGADLIGVNNRNLKTFTTDIEISLKLAEIIPDEFVKVSESGINEPQNLLRLRAAGFRGFLMGEHFMQDNRPEVTCAKFIQQVIKCRDSAILEN